MDREQDGLALFLCQVLPHLLCLELDQRKWVRRYNARIRLTKTNHSYVCKDNIGLMSLLWDYQKANSCSNLVGSPLRLFSLPETVGRSSSTYVNTVFQGFYFVPPQKWKLPISKNETQRTRAISHIQGSQNCLIHAFYIKRRKIIWER